MVKKPVRLSFTQRGLNALAAPAGRVHYLYDTKTAGLRLAVHPTGRKTFSLYRKIKGRAATIPLGRFPDVPVAEARAAALALNAEIAHGRDPRDRLGRRNPTLGELLIRYLEERVRPESRGEVAKKFALYLHPWRDRRLGDITRADIERLHRAVGVARPLSHGSTKKRGGHYAANRMLSLLSALYNAARAWGLSEGENPCHGIRKFYEIPRDRYLRPDELERFVRMLADEPNQDLRDYLGLRLGTGVRERNIFEMRWEDVDLDRGAWRIGVTKNGDPLFVHLGPLLVAALRARPRINVWVFPGRKAGDHVRDLQKAWQAFRRRLGPGFANVQLKDLRRTNATYKLQAGTPMPVIARSLGQRSIAVTSGVYALPMEAAVTEASDRAQARLLGAPEEGRDGR